jgi:NADPH2:quinone reductase
VAGSEGSGEVVAVGPGVTDFKVGDRGAYAGAPGGYAEERVMPADRLVKLPDSIDYKTGAAMMLQGMTVRYLLRQTYKVDSKTTMLFHAAAGGVGLIACQWARHLGATVIGTVSTPDKVELAKAHGCTHVINYKTEDFVKRTKELTNGQGVDVVYDAVGKDTYPGSLDCLKPLGLWVSFGNASGAISNFDLLSLSAKGSLYATRPTLGTYIAKRADLLAMPASCSTSSPRACPDQHQPPTLRMLRRRTATSRPARPPARSCCPNIIRPLPLVGDREGDCKHSRWGFPPP